MASSSRRRGGGNFSASIAGAIRKGIRAYAHPYKNPGRGGYKKSDRDYYVSRARTNTEKFNILDYTKNFDEELWEESYTEIIAAQEEKAGNAGQTTLLSDEQYFPGAAANYCKTYSEDYDPPQFVDNVSNELGDDYYNAIREIIDECAEELLEAWAQCWQDGEGGDLLTSALDFGGFFSRNTVYGTFGNAVSAYNNRAAAKFGTRNWNGSKAHLAAKQSTIVKFLRANPQGTSRTTRATPFAGRTYAQRQAVSRAAATKFLAANPKGTKRTNF
jgi:hypothetical protein